MEAIRKSVETFESHESESQHNQEMAAGADAALLKHLVFVLHQQRMNQEYESSNTTRVDFHAIDSSPNPGSITTETALTVQAMELVYRSSSTMVGASFTRLGTVLLRLLLDLMEAEIDRRRPHAASFHSQPTDSHTPYDYNIGNPQLSDYDATHDASMFLLHATKLFGHFARVGDVIQTMAHFPKCLQVLTGLCQPPYHVVPWQARLSALWTLANLACHAENMQLMVAQDGLVEMLVQVASRSIHQDDDDEDAVATATTSLEHLIEVLKSRNIASRAILNLSWAPENKIVLADNGRLLELVAQSCLHRQAPALAKSQTVVNILLATRRHAVGALRNLAAAPRLIKLQLCAYREGHLLDVLTDAALNDPDGHVKERAFAAINNLANQDTAEQIVNHPALVLALRDVLLSSSTSSDEETAIKQHASSTILVLERTITPSMGAYENLRALLDAINPTPVSSEGELERGSATSSVSGDDGSMRVKHSMAV
jgi:hypothetical protein